MRKIISFALLFGAIFVYYFFVWGSLQNFNQTFDPCEPLFCDFTIHYYPTAQTIFETKEPLNGYLYSPFFAILTAPLGMLPLASALQVWGVIQIILTLLLFVAPLSALKLDSLTNEMLYAGIFFTSLPVIHNFKWGQVSSLMTLAIIAAWLAHKNGKPIWAGILLGFSASIKYYPALFVLYCLFKKDYRALGAFSLTCFLLLFALPISALGFEHWLHFTTSTFQKLSALSATAANPNTQYAPYVFARLLGIDPARLFVLKLFQWVGFGVAFCNLLLLWFVQKSKLDSDGLISITLLFCTLPFLIETAWHHYFIFLPFIQFVFFKSAEKSAKLYAALSAILSSVFIYNFFSSWENYAQWGFSFFSALAILICVYQTVFNNWRSQRRAYAQL